MFNMPVPFTVGRRSLKAVRLGPQTIGAGAIAWPAAYLSSGGFLRATHLPPTLLTIGAIGLAGYTAFFLFGEAALLVLAVVNIQDEELHNRYKSLMLLVLYVFTLRYRRVLPTRFFTESDMDSKDPAAAVKSREPGKHRGKRSTSPRTHESDLRL